MSSAAEVRLWGRKVGVILLEDDEDVADFEYDPDFAGSGIEVAPIVMPLSPGVYRFPDLSRQTFRGLPGLLSDCLPDRFGNALIDAWLASQGRTPDGFNAIERLCYTGTRGMGALEFEPAIGPDTSAPALLQVDRLVEFASDILSRRGDLSVSFAGEEQESALLEILRVGTSAGGARAKAVIAWNPQTNEVRSGEVAAGDDFEYWLMKFDGVSGNRDKELEDPRGYGAAEYAYYLMAQDCGIEMSECRLFEEGGRRHFMTRRFDRLAGGEKLHLQSLGALAHYDFHLAGAHAYEEAFMIMRRLGLPARDLEQQFRRMVFNIIARNQDDHVKNIAFLMNSEGEWSLSPAFDVTHSYNPSGKWTATHQMTMNGKREGFVMDDFKACARSALMKNGCAHAIVAEVQETVSRWDSYAEAAGVADEFREKVRRNLILKPFP